MKTALVLAAVVLQAADCHAQGTIKGCVADWGGGVLPGVDIVATSALTQVRAVTDSSGCYELRTQAGTYSVTAALVGFVTAKRQEVVVVGGGTVDHVNFRLCVGGMTEIDWVLPGGLTEAWKHADAVAQVRIVATGPAYSECGPTGDFQHTAAVIEMFKGTWNPLTQPTLTFRQENWASERTPYAIGQEMILFLVATEQGWLRLAGPYYVLLVNDDEITSFHSPIRTDGMTPAECAVKLRAMAKESKIP